MTTKAPQRCASTRIVTSDRPTRLAPPRASAAPPLTPPPPHTLPSSTHTHRPILVTRPRDSREDRDSLRQATPGRYRRGARSARAPRTPCFTFCLNTIPKGLAFSKIQESALFGFFQQRSRSLRCPRLCNSEGTETADRDGLRRLLLPALRPTPDEARIRRARLGAEHTKLLAAAEARELCLDGELGASPSLLRVSYSAARRGSRR